MIKQALLFGGLALVTGNNLQAAHASHHGHEADFTFLDTKGFLAGAGSLCQISI